MNRIGVLGGGQLGQMLGYAAQNITEAELECIFYDQSPNPCAASAGQVYRDFAEFAAQTDLFTYEFENVSQDLAEQLATKAKIRPNLAALQIAADRYKEKSLFDRLELGTPRWLPLNSAAELPQVAAELGLPLVVKTARLGYDGKGQFRIKDAATVAQVAAELAELQFATPIGECPLIVEEFVPFRRELSCIAVRGLNGEVAHYPTVENVHKHGILYSSSAPATLRTELQTQLREWLEKILTALDYVGILSLELFEKEPGLFLANEMAPRVHNSGHWSIEGAATSQFENHLRAIAGLPLGPTGACGFSKMFNLVGTATGVSAAAQTTAHPPAAKYVHLYGKEARPGRKLGHITYNAATPHALRAATSELHAQPNFVVATPQEKS